MIGNYSSVETHASWTTVRDEVEAWLKVTHPVDDSGDWHPIGL